MKRFITVLAAASLTACAGTQNTAAPVEDAFAPKQEPLVQSCVDQVYARENVDSHRSVSFYTALVSNAKACLAPLENVNKHPQKDQIMKLYAVVITNSIKAHDSEQAAIWLAKFRSDFPMQDLLLDDYTSFVDTMNALLNSEDMDRFQLARLNISTQLKQELTRQQQWLAN